MDVRQRGTIGVAGGDAGNSTSSLATSQRAMARRTISDGKRSGASSGSSLTWMIGICLVIVVIVFVSGAVDFTSSAESSDSSRSTVRRTKEQVDQDQKQIQTLQEENKSLKQQVSKLKKQNADKAAEVAAAAAIPTDQGELAKQLKRLREYKRRMHDMIQLISKRNLIYKYGPGPHIVEILLSFDPASNVADASKAPDDTETLLIELAPVDEMPATVFWFLEQVNATAFDGCSFHRNAGHVVQGGPAPNFETLAGQRPMQKFRETELDSVPFQE
jgi:hypothetical protein